MKTIALMLMLAVCSVSLGGCFVGKGKAPAPIATRG
jgi:predicted small secreted protein